MARVLLAVHLAVLTWLSLRPVPVSWTEPANLTPLASVHHALDLGGFAAVRRLAAGLLPLAPVGVLIPLAGGRLHTRWLPSFLRTTGAVALLATGLEIIEGWAPGHVLDVDDILLGTVGAALCHLLVVPPLRALSAHRPARADRADRADRAGKTDGPAAAPNSGTTTGPLISAVLSPSGTSMHRPPGQPAAG
ncbi:VanZ family protein [Kitasatospora cinereorecta]|uniref:VanZ family protein n=1 Tax=Kitasatospora cinereorecta TaxID=285560 RepID=A0ABW0VPY8_9ACTN